MGSSEPLRTRELAQRAAARGVELIDAPVSGGVRGALAGSLTIMVGGDPAPVARCRPLLETLGRAVLHVGPVGAGHALKALNNLLSATHLLASCEALAIGRRFGLDPQVMLDAINVSTGRCASTERKLPDFVLTGSYDSGFALALMVKDVGIAVALGEGSGSSRRSPSARSRSGARPRRHSPTTPTTPRSRAGSRARKGGGDERSAGAGPTRSSPSATARCAPTRASSTTASRPTASPMRHSRWTTSSTCFATAPS